MTLHNKDDLLAGGECECFRSAMQPLKMLNSSIFYIYFFYIYIVNLIVWFYAMYSTLLLQILLICQQDNID